MPSLNLPPSPPAHKGSATISGICIWENQRLYSPNKKNSIVIDGQFYVPGANVDNNVIGMYRLYNDGSVDFGIDPGAFFVTAVVSAFSQIS